MMYRPSGTAISKLLWTPVLCGTNCPQPFISLSTVQQNLRTSHSCLTVSIPMCCRWNSNSSTHDLTSAQSLPWKVIAPYGSIRVNLTEAMAEGWSLDKVEDFPHILKSLVSTWKSKGHSAVWLHIPIALSGLIGLASKQGFTLHHGAGEEVVMNRWLLDHKPNKLPCYASHQVGVCGVVLREDTHEVLVTQDKYKPPVWKFPGGLSDFGEDIADAAVREVKEETGIDTEFRSILAFRQQHRLRQYFNISDLFFICRLHPLNYTIQPCQDEVLQCCWMKLEDLAKSNETTPISHRTIKLLFEALDNRSAGVDGSRSSQASSFEQGFKNIDIAMEEWPMNFPQYAVSKSYKLFLRSIK